MQNFQTSTSNGKKNMFATDDKGGCRNISGVLKLQI